MEQLKAETEVENVRIEEQKKVIEEQLKDVEPMIRVSTNPFFVFTILSVL